MNEDDANIMNPELSWVYCPFYLDLLPFLPARLSGYCPGLQRHTSLSRQPQQPTDIALPCPRKVRVFPNLWEHFVFEKCDLVNITSSCHLSASQRGLLSELSVLFYLIWRHPGQIHQPWAKSQDQRCCPPCNVNTQKILRKSLGETGEDAARIAEEFWKPVHNAI